MPQILTLAMSLHLQTGQLSNLGGNVRGSDQCLADKDCIYIGASETLNILSQEYSRFRNDRDAFGNRRTKLLRRFQARLEC